MPGRATHRSRRIRPSVAVAEKDALEMLLHVLERHIRRPASVMMWWRELPIVVPAALVLVILNLLARDRDAGEVLHGRAMVSR